MSDSNNFDDYMEKELLSKKDLLEYDLERTFYMVCKFMSRYKRLKCKNFDEAPIKITKNFKYIFVDEATKGINDYNKLDKYIDLKTEYKCISATITNITNSLFTDEEIVYYTICLYNGKSESRAFKTIGCSNKGLIPIKNSCIVKFACAFDIEVYNGDKLSDEDEIKFKNFMNN